MTRWCNPLKGLGRFDASVDYIRGRLHLPDITRSYKQKNKLSAVEGNSIAQALKMATDQAIAVGRRKSRKRMHNSHQNQSIVIDSRHFITQYEPTRNCMSAIAAVDYATRATKPTCGLVMDV